MKSIFTGLIFTVFISCNSSAQLTKGSYVVGGSASFSFSKSPDDINSRESKTGSITPNFGKFVSEKYLLEVGLGYAYENRSFQFGNDYFNRQTSNLFSIQFGATRFFPIADQLYFTLGASITPAFKISKSETESNGNFFDEESSTISAKLNIAPGLAYFINKKWMIYSFVGALNYEVDHNTSSNLTGHEFYVNVSANSFGLGARYILGKKTKAN